MASSRDWLETAIFSNALAEDGKAAEGKPSLGMINFGFGAEFSEDRWGLGPGVDEEVLLESGFLEDFFPALCNRRSLFRVEDIGYSPKVRTVANR